MHLARYSLYSSLIAINSFFSELMQWTIYFIISMRKIRTSCCLQYSSNFAVVCKDFYFILVLYVFCSSLYSALLYALRKSIYDWSCLLQIYLSAFSYKDCFILLVRNDKVIEQLIKVFRFVPSYGRSFHFQF